MARIRERAMSTTALVERKSVRERMQERTRELFGGRTMDDIKKAINETVQPVPVAGRKTFIQYPRIKMRRLGGKSRK